MKKPILFGIIALFFFSTCQAWNQRGHQIVASIAYNHLTERKQKAFTELLQDHAYYQEWKAEFDNQKEVEDEGLFLFLKAAAWPDDLKRPEFNFPFVNESWHYCNYKVDFKNGHKNQRLNPRADLLYALGWGKNIMSAKWEDENGRNTFKYTSESKAIALSWLIHLIGDLHQPLHTSTLYNEYFPEGDAGGNKVFVRKKDKAKTIYSLHQYWDNLPGDNDVSYKTILKQGEALSGEYDPLELVVFEEKNPYKWIEESHRKCIERVYDNGSIGGNVNYSNRQVPPILPEAYQDMAKSLTEKQMYVAGKRIAEFIGRLQWMEK